MIITQDVNSKRLANNRRKVISVEIAIITKDWIGGKGKRKIIY